MIVGAVADPLNWDRWPEVEAYLEPARARGDFAAVIEPDEALYVVLDGGDLLAAATAWLSTEHYVEVKLVGGRDRSRWLKQLDQRIGADALAAGAARLLAIGRRGWLRELERLGWERLSEVDGMTVYSRELKERG